MVPRLVAGMGRAERREAMGLYVQGLLLDGERKSMEPMASRLIDDPSELVAMRQRLQECFAYYEDEAYDRLRAAARARDLRCLVVVLLGAEAGLRAGEIVALRLRHCDLRRGVVHVEENDRWWAECP
ncbi:MAG: transposase [Nannocystis sp.]|nr:transposase [Nannocystis sp.]MBA3549909.1 transposase [Nannocystis sp.]